MNFYFLLRAIIITFPAQEGLSKGFHREVSNVCSTEKSHSKLMSKKGLPIGELTLGGGVARLNFIALSGIMGLIGYSEFFYS